MNNGKRGKRMKKLLLQAVGKFVCGLLIFALILFVVILSLVLRYVNGYATFPEAFGYGFLLWTVVNLYDLAVLDILWFCHDPHFVIKGTEDMVKDYHDYRFHARGFLIGEALALVVCVLAGLTVRFVLP